MEQERLERLLNELTDMTAEQVRVGLAEDIKHRIPRGLAPHRGRLDTINIIIDLRISKLAAAAVIILTMILCANFLGNRDSTGQGIYKDSKLLMEYILGSGGAGGIDVSTMGMSRLYEYLVQQGRDVTYYGDSSLGDSNAVIMRWNLPDGRYGVIFGDLRTKTIAAEELIELQAQMLQKKVK